MAEQIRSADLLVKTALASPEILDALKNKPEETLKSLGKDATLQLPRVPSRAESNHQQCDLADCRYLVCCGHALGSLYPG